jgi:pimeloyl-ACP methyl ester carboxylesterase
MRADMPSAHALEQRALAALLDRVGPAVVITHSAGGPAGFLAAEARPGAVVALVTIEPLGPPFLRIAPIGVSLDWGLAAAPFEFDPPASDPAELEDGTGRRLVNLSKVPIILVSTAHSKLGAAGAETVAFLRSAGCDAEEMKLAENGFCRQRARGDARAQQCRGPRVPSRATLPARLDLRGKRSEDHRRFR